MVYVSVNETEHNLRAVALLGRLDCLDDSLQLKSYELLLQSRTTNTISIDDYLLWKWALVCLLIVLQSLNHEIANNIASKLGHNLLFLVLGQSFTLSFFSLWQVVRLDLSEVLRNLLCSRSAQPEYGFALRVNNIGTDNHGVPEVRKIHVIEVSSHFSIHLLQEIGKHSKSLCLGS